MSLNEPSVFELLKFDCTCIAILMQSMTGIDRGRRECGSGGCVCTYGGPVEGHQGKYFLWSFEAYQYGFYGFVECKLQ